MPHTFNNIKFIPQLFYKLIFLPFGIQSTQIHINYWKDKNFIEFENFIKKNHQKIINMDYAFSKNTNGILNKFSNFLIKSVLRIKKTYCLNFEP